MAEILVAHRAERECSTLAERLREEGHDVICASTGPSAAELLDSRRFEIVLAQAYLPGLDARSLVSRAAGASPFAQVILLVAKGAADPGVPSAPPAGAYALLAEPVQDLDGLAACVARAIDFRRLRMQNATLSTDLASRLRELDDVRRRIADVAEHDALTGLLNHTAIYARLRGAVQRSHDSAPAVMLADMDGFRSINETYGHAVGDDLLRYVAASLREVCAAHSEIGRSGSDEFMAVFTGGNAEVAARAADCIRCHLAGRPYTNPQGTRIPVQLSFGIADARTAGLNATSLVAAADAALNEGRQRGGGAVTLHMAEPDDGSVELSSRGVLDGLITAIDNKDRYTRHHSEDVAKYAVMLGEAVGLPGDQLDTLRVAGLVHDVGKIGMPDSVLLKPGRLTAEEAEAMKAHVTLSCHILQGVPGFDEIRDAVAYHHERWDGRGYPNGIAGDEIPLLSRILGIADAYSAMTLDRRYRAGLPHGEAIAEVEREAGAQFDPFLARLFVDIVRDRLDLPQMELLRAA